MTCQKRVKNFPGNPFQGRFSMEDFPGKIFQGRLSREDFPEKTYQGRLSRENIPEKTFQGKLSRKKGKLEKDAPKAFAGEAGCNEDRYPGPP